MAWRQLTLLAFISLVATGSYAVEVTQRRKAASRHGLQHSRGQRALSREKYLRPLHKDAATAAKRHRTLQKLLSRVSEDLKPWKDGITLGMVERTYCTDYEKSFRLQVINGSMYVVGEMTGFQEFNRVTKLLLLEVARNHKIPDLDVVFTTADGCPMAKTPFSGDQERCPQEGPLFAFDKRTDADAHCVLFPDFTFGSGGWPLARLPSWAAARDVMELEAEENLPWAQRVPKLFFRGAPTGNRAVLARDAAFVSDTAVDFRLTGWTGKQQITNDTAIPVVLLSDEQCGGRLKLFHQGGILLVGTIFQHIERVDRAILCHFQPDSVNVVLHLLRCYGLTPPAEYVSLPEHCKYRYLLNLPGNGWSVRLKYLMLCGSTVLFAKNGWEEFWYSLLEPDVNVIVIPPVTDETNGVNILEALRKAQIHTEKAARIGEAGRELVRNFLTPETIHRYFAELLQQYAALQKFQPSLHQDAVPLQYSVMRPDGGHTLQSRTCTVCGLKAA